ncbi:MAG: hypothetical protein KAQ89_00065 [Planctomycetes bacterium]|nr:hypothetical protein [Planctomycetota bacterium]
MIRFIDLSGQDTGYKFAFWSTVSDSFFKIAGVQAWNTYQEFEKDCNSDNMRLDYKDVCPKWVFETKPHQEHIYDNIKKTSRSFEISKTDKRWITTSPIEITPLHGTRPMHPALSKKLYYQNAIKYTSKCKIPSVPTGVLLSRFRPAHADITVAITTINKYTIVELTHNNKHYHGLASRADCDKENAVTGIAVAYHRAFEKMMQHLQTSVVDYSPIHKAKTWKEIWADNKFDTSTYRECIDKHLKDAVDKQSKLVDKAISDLLSCTDVDLKQYDLKTVLGGKAAIKEISKYGYNIYELQNMDSLILTYVLQRCGVEITRRDIKLTLPTDRFDETQNNLKLHLKSIAKDRSELP